MNAIVKHLTMENDQHEITAQSGLVLIDVWVDWCLLCKAALTHFR